MAVYARAIEPLVQDLNVESQAAGAAS